MGTRRMGPVLYLQALATRTKLISQEGSQYSLVTRLACHAYHDISLFFFKANQFTIAINSPHDLIFQHGQDLPPAKLLLTDDTIAVACAEMR